MKIGIDIMGGDFAPESTVLGAVLAHKEIPDSVRLVLIGKEKEIHSLLHREGVDADDFDIVNATEVIGMGDYPTRAFYQKLDSSINVGFKLLKEKKIDAFAGIGNTGAMLVGAMHSVHTISGVIRPCITSHLPKENGGVGLILDVGMNADCKADVLYQFAILGSIFVECLYDIKNPKVGLLNIGEEAKKGNMLTQTTYELMEGTEDFNFIGNVEGRDLFNEKADVIVCDGFTGNVVLKGAEAFYTLIKNRKISDEYFDRFNYMNYGGTPILGINSTVMIGHGISNAITIKNMILLTKNVVESQLTEKIKKVFE